ncbi:hypothetical protein FOZ60_014308 [Perkinsus olseni]|uniref:Uncharacterized protein n=1 Tax=Perkinsus olseni TaxID=32597 RepID=A0A7J6P759_PEROL|nr:hypothetical protein FOZ60_014308 [Perkinsus olseni]
MSPSMSSQDFSLNDAVLRHGSPRNNSSFASRGVHAADLRLSIFGALSPESATGCADSCSERNKMFNVFD